MQNDKIVLPRKLIDVLETHKEVVDAFAVEKSPYNKHRLHSVLSANGYTNSRERERFIKMVAQSRRWGRV
jgi:hypothetical protein